MKTFEYSGIQVNLKQLEEWWEERARLQALFDGRKEFLYMNYPLEPIQFPNSRRMIYPKNHGYCYWCGRKLSGRRRSYCSDKHADYYHFWFNWNRVRMSVYNLADGICQSCQKPDLWFERREDLKEFKINDLGEIDHILAIALGGNNWDLENLQLLCHDCHKKKTRKDIYRIYDSPKSKLIELTEFLKIRLSGD